MSTEIKTQAIIFWKLYLCWISLCSFGWVYSACSPDCLDSMLGDGNCNEECNNWDCDLDNHDCGQCAIGCFPEMLGNSVCDPECNNEDCGYDYNDCQCAENCLWTEYGNCKPECLVASCNYDRVSQYPNLWCQDTSLAIFASYQQIIRSDYSYVVKIEDCFEASNYNCTDEKALNFSQCYEECNIFECNYSNGNCDEPYFPCSRSYNNSYGCLNCKIFYPNFFSALKDKGCVDAANYYYTWKLPDWGDCRDPLIDTSSIKNPHIYFLSDLTDYHQWYADGSRSLPYVFNDIYKIHHANAIAYLLEDGNFALETPMYFWEANNYNAGILLDNFRQKNIKLTTLNDTKVTIKRKKDNIKDSIFWFSLKNVSGIEINNVIFDWKDTLSACNDGDYCDYCSECNSDTISSLFYNDRGEIISNCLSSTWCQYNQDINFFEVRESNLVLNNVIFKNFRTDFNSLIYVVNGNVTLNNVTFDNVKVHDGEKSAVIVWDSINNERHDSGSLKFINGIVKRLNNGYELKDAITTRGFLYAVNITSVYIRNVEFRHNVMLKQSLKSIWGPSLIYLNSFKELWIDSCNFLYNYCDMGIIYIEQSDKYYQAEANDLGEIIYSKLNHIHIKDSNFTSNYGKFAGILYAIYEDEVQNWFIENSTFIMNGVESGSLIYLESSNLNTNYLEDTMMNVSLLDGSIISAKYFAKWGKIYSSNFTKNYSGGNGILEIINMINVELKDIEMLSNGMATIETMNINSILLKYYINDPELYPKLIIIDPYEINCITLSSISNSINFYMNSVQIRNNYCKNHSTNFIISESENVTIENSYFAENSGSVSDGVCLAILQNVSIVIRNSIFDLNQNRHSGGAGAISSLSNLLVQNCTFSNNIGSGALYFNAKVINVTSSYFDSNKSPNSNAGGIYFLATSDAEEFFFYLSNVKFTNNYAYLYGGGIFFHITSLFKPPLFLSFTDIIFFKNQALSGSGFYIDESVRIAIDSSIKIATL